MILIPDQGSTDHRSRSSSKIKYLRNNLFKVMQIDTSHKYTINADLDNDSKQDSTDAGGLRQNVGSGVIFEFA